VSEDSNSDEPAWMVIAPLSLDDITAVIDGVLVGDTWQLIEGARGHIAITGELDTRGVEDRLAEDLSQKTDQPVYALVFDEDDPRVDAFIGGAEAGVVAANLYDVAHVLGVGIDARDEAEHVDVDLTPHLLPEAGDDEPLVLGKTLRQWEHLIAYELNWDLALDDAPGDEVLPLLDGDPATRRIAVKLVGGLGPDAFAGVDDVIAKLHELAAADPTLADDVDEAIELLEDDDTTGA
jgi:hypothetical protein